MLVLLCYSFAAALYYTIVVFFYLLNFGFTTVVSMLDNFGVTCTFEFFITIGLLMSIPFSAGKDIFPLSQYS